MMGVSDVTMLKHSSRSFFFCFSVIFLTLLSSGALTFRWLMSLAGQGLCSCICLVFYWAVSGRISSIKRCTSNKDLRDIGKDNNKEQKEHAQWLDNYIYHLLFIGCSLQCLHIWSCLFSVDFCSKVLIELYKVQIYHIYCYLYIFFITLTSTKNSVLDFLATSVKLVNLINKTLKLQPNYTNKISYSDSCFVLWIL